MRRTCYLCGCWTADWFAGAGEEWVGQGESGEEEGSEECLVSSQLFVSSHDNNAKQKQLDGSLTEKYIANSQMNRILSKRGSSTQRIMLRISVYCWSDTSRKDNCIGEGEAGASGINT